MSSVKGEERAPIGAMEEKTYIGIISQQLDTIVSGRCESEISNLLSDRSRQHWRTESKSEQDRKKLRRHDRKKKELLPTGEEKKGEVLVATWLSALYTTVLGLVSFGAVSHFGFG